MSYKQIGDYQLIEFKGKGTFGSVYGCKKDGNIYAMKIFSALFLSYESIRYSITALRVFYLKSILPEFRLKYNKHK